MVLNLFNRYELNLKILKRFIAGILPAIGMQCMSLNGTDLNNSNQYSITVLTIYSIIST